MPFTNHVLRLALLFACFYACAECGAATTSSQKNILLLISDDQGRDLGCYGNSAVHTPNLDRLAARGTMFTNAFAAVSSCSPSRATILTGMYNHANGMYGLAHGAHNQRTRPNIKTLPQILSKNGYRTGLLGKYHLAPEQSYPFDVLTAEKDSRNAKALGRHTRKFIEGTAGQPFFLTVGFSDTHRAGAVFPDYSREGPTTASKAKASSLPPFLMDLPEVRADYDAYLESVNNLDRCVGAVLSALDEAGKTSSTLVVFLSDNGIPFPGAKTTLYDAGIHLPMILHAPDSASVGMESDAMVSFVDVAPTILQWASLDETRGMQGESFLSELNHPGAVKRDKIFASHTMHEIQMWYPMRTVRTRDFQLIWNVAYQLPFTVAGDVRRSPSWEAISGLAEGEVNERPVTEYLQRPEFELYHVALDPIPTHNLAEDAEHRETLNDLKAEMLKSMRESKDPWLNIAQERLK